MLYVLYTPDLEQYSLAYHIPTLSGLFGIVAGDYATVVHGLTLEVHQLLVIYTSRQLLTTHLHSIIYVFEMGIVTK